MSALDERENFSNDRVDKKTVGGSLESKPVNNKDDDSGQKVDKRVVVNIVKKRS